MDARMIIEAAEKLSREKRDPEFWMPWINAALDDLTPAARLVTALLVPLIAGRPQYDLPDDCHKVVSVSYFQGDSESPLTQRSWRDASLPGFKLGDGIIRLQGLPLLAGDEIEIVYFRRIAHVEDVSETPDLQPEWHELIVLFLVFRVGTREEFADLRNTSQAEYYARRQALDALTLLESEGAQGSQTQRGAD